jgi:ribosome maturation factor RimP
VTAKQQAIESKVFSVAEPLLEAEGLELLDVEFIKEHGDWVLRLYIDKPGAAVGIDECTQASRVVDPALDVEDVVPHEYSLEVSSPGLNRPLRKPAHFLKAVGQQVRLKTFGPLGEPPRKNFLGALSHVSESGVTVSVDGSGDFVIAFKDIAKATLEHQFT